MAKPIKDTLSRFLGRRLSPLHLLLTVFACLSISPLPAQEIRSVETVCKIYPDGSAGILQSWDVTVTSGTEWYIPIGNLNGMEISDFHVYEGEEEREYLDEGRSWDSGRDLSQKALRSGIVDKGADGVELCWGLGSYGSHQWYITYTISGLVQRLQDYDAFNHMFINPGLVSPPQKASLYITNNTGGPKWTQENVRVWGFGYEGTVRVNNNAVVLETTAPMKKDSRMIAMVRFDKGLLEPAVSRDISFSEMEKKALKGSDYSSGRSFSAFWKSIDPRLRYGFWLVLPVLLLLLYFLLGDVRRKISGKVWKENFFGTGKIDGYWREAPFEGRLAVSYFVLKCGSTLIWPPKWEKNIIGAYLLKWISDGRIHPEKDPGGKTILRITDDSTENIVSSSEKELFGYITAAAGENGILEKDELKRWSRNHPDTLYYWLENDLTAEGRVWIREHGGKWTGEAFEDEPSRAEARKVVQFKNFLHDFTLVSERQTPEVGLWKQYLIYAQLFGISKKVAANLRHLYPAQFEDFSRNDFNTKDFDLREVLALTSSFAAPVSASAKNPDADSGSSRSSGGGGSSSYGGGGGHSGGGYGGGTR